MIVSLLFRPALNIFSTSRTSLQLAQTLHQRYKQSYCTKSPIQATCPQALCLACAATPSNVPSSPALHQVSSQLTTPILCSGYWACLSQHWSNSSYSLTIPAYKVLRRLPLAGAKVAHT